MSAIVPCICAKGPCISASAKEPCISAKVPCICAKRPCISAKGPCICTLWPQGGQSTLQEPCATTFFWYTQRIPWICWVSPKNTLQECRVTYTKVPYGRFLCDAKGCKSHTILEDTSKKKRHPEEFGCPHRKPCKNLVWHTHTRLMVLCCVKLQSVSHTWFLKIRQKDQKIWTRLVWL